MLLTLYDKSNNQKMEIEPSDSSTWTKAVQSDNVLSLSFVLYECITLEVNDYIDLYGERFWLIDRYTPKQKSSVEWEYDIKLYGIESLIKRYLVVKLVNGDNETEFSYTATAYDHVALIVQNINAGMETSSWKVGEVVTSELLVIDYEGTYCNDGLKKVAELTGVEYWVEGTTVNVSRCEHGELLTLGYGKGLTSLYSDKADNVKFFTRLFPIGGTRNISYDDYGHSRLQLPGGVKYIDQDTDKFGIVHHYEKEAFEDIYPRRIGKVSNVRSKEVKGESGKPFTIYYFKDDSLSFNPNDYEMNGLVKMVSFQDNSSLAGRDFEVNYNDKTKEFEIITQWPYDNDIQIPNEQLSPKILDEYILWNIKMPIEYYALAEVEYQDAVKKYMVEQRKDVAVYKAHTDYIDIDDPNIDIRVGRRVRLEHSQYFAEGYRNSRITKITRKVVRPMDMDIEISDALSKGAIESIKDSVDKVTDDNRENIENVRKESLQFTQRRYRDAIETMEMLSAALLDNFTNSITPISVQTMQLILGDESLQFILTTSKTKPDNNIITPNFFFDTEDAGRFKVDFRGAATVYLQHKTLGIDSLSSSHTDFKTWRMAEFTSAPLTDANKSYYLYAKVATTNVPDAQVFYLSETAIGINDVEGYHHLLVGVLNREIDGERSFSSLYGFAELTPGRLTIPLISSPDGGTYFDLVTGEIAGQITFKAGSKGLKDVEEWAGVESDINSAQDAADAAQAAADKGVSDAADALAKALKAEADAANSVADYNAKFALQQAQIDGEVSNWYYPHKPLLTNAPANTWVDNAEKDRHIGDTFLNTQPYVDDKTTPDAGKAWRWVKNGTVYSWTAISDSDAVKALQEAAKALATADGKSTTFVLTGTTTPKTYDLGDMWVLQSDTVHTPNKQGEVLFSTTNRTNQYVAADWVTKVRYTDDTAIKELQIGGVNLIRYNNTAVNDAWVGFYSIVSVSPDKIIRGTSNVVTTGWPRIANNIGKYITAFDLTKQYTISFYARANDALNSLLAISDPSDSNKAYGTSLSLTSQWQYFSLTFIPLKQIVAATYLMIYCGKTGVPDTTSFVELKDVQLEQGNKATSWTPAVADVQFEIDSAQTTASAAMGRVDVMAKDNVISIEEKARLRNENIELGKEYDKLKELATSVGITIEVKTATSGTSKLWSAYNGIQTAFGSAWVNISNNTDYTFVTTVGKTKSDYLDKFAAWKDAVSDLGKQISQKQVDRVQIGGRNLALNSKIDLTTNSYLIHTASLSEELQDGQEIAITVNGELPEGKSYYVATSPSSAALSLLPKTGVGQYSGTIKFRINPRYPNDVRNKLMFFNFPNDGNYPSVTNAIMVTKGNKPLDWVAAPEDVQAEIDAAQSAANQAIADLATINSDKIVSPPEKPALKAQWDMLLSEKASIDKSAELYLLTGSTEYQNYVTGSGKAIAAYAKYSNTAIKDIPIGADYADMSLYQNHKKEVLKRIEEAIKAVQDTIKAQADKGVSDAADAQAKISTLDYLKAAFSDGSTEIFGGITLTELLAVKNGKVITGYFSGVNNTTVLDTTVSPNVNVPVEFYAFIAGIPITFIDGGIAYDRNTDASISTFLKASEQAIYRVDWDGKAYMSELYAGSFKMLEDKETGKSLFQAINDFGNISITPDERLTYDKLSGSKYGQTIYLKEPIITYSNPQNIFYYSNSKEYNIIGDLQTEIVCDSSIKKLNHLIRLHINYTTPISDEYRNELHRLSLTASGEDLFFKEIKSYVKASMVYFKLYVDDTSGMKTFHLPCQYGRHMDIVTAKIVNHDNSNIYIDLEYELFEVAGSRLSNLGEIRKSGNTTALYAEIDKDIEYKSYDCNFISNIYPYERVNGYYDVTALESRADFSIKLHNFNIKSFLIVLSLNKNIIAANGIGIYRDLNNFFYVFNDSQAGNDPNGQALPAKMGFKGDIDNQSNIPYIFAYCNVNSNGTIATSSGQINKFGAGSSMITCKWTGAPLYCYEITHNMGTLAYSAFITRGGTTSVSEMFGNEGVVRKSNTVEVYFTNALGSAAVQRDFQLIIYKY